MGAKILPTGLNLMLLGSPYSTSICFYCSTFPAGLACSDAAIIDVVGLMLFYEGNVSFSKISVGSELCG